MDKAKTTKLGKCIVERDGNGFLLMTPDGDVRYAPSKKLAEAYALAWYKENTGSDEISIGSIEWR